MADYILEVPLTDNGRDILADPDALSAVITEGVYMISGITYNNLTVEGTIFDAETNKMYYYVIASPQMKMGLASLDAVERLAWWNTLLAGTVIVAAVVCVVAFGWPAIIPAAVVIGVALAYDAITGYIEVRATIADAKKEIVDAVVDGRITSDEGNRLLKDIDESWASGIPWNTIIIGGMVGVGALAALYIFMKTRK